MDKELVVTIFAIAIILGFLVAFFGVLLVPIISERKSKLHTMTFKKKPINSDGYIYEINTSEIIKQLYTIDNYEFEIISAEIRPYPCICTIQIRCNKKVKSLIFSEFVLRLKNYIDDISF